MVGGLIAEVAVLALLASWGKGVPVGGMIVRRGGAAIEVASQAGPWGVLYVSRVVTPVPSWVVVQARQGAGGAPGAVLGVTPVPAGTTRNVSVVLDPKGGAVNTVVVSILADRGQAGVFEYSPPSAGGGGGMMGVSASPSKSGAAAPEAAPTADKPLVADGKSISVVVSETYRNGAPGTVERAVLP